MMKTSAFSAINGVVQLTLTRRSIYFGKLALNGILMKETMLSRITVEESEWLLMQLAETSNQMQLGGNDGKLQNQPIPFLLFWLICRRLLMFSLLICQLPHQLHSHQQLYQLHQHLRR